MILFAGIVFSYAAFFLFAWKRLRRYLHIYQQDEYDTGRFLPWLIKSRAFDRRVSLALLVLVCGAITNIFSQQNSLYLTGLIFLVFGLIEADPTKVAKKPLVMTKRATRLFVIIMIFIAIVGLVVVLNLFVWPWIVLVQMLPAFMLLANAALHPFESRIQQHFLHEAQVRLAEINPKIIGITGSFGKTSVKHILGNVLDLNAKSYFAQGSINTLMGISRVIREQLPVACEFFIVEMGAYGKGSVSRLCDLTPPQLGIITSIGEAHYERFKDLDTVARAKFELADAVLKNPDGKVIVHSSVLTQKYARDYIMNNRKRFIVCGEGSDADAIIDSWEQTQQGMQVVLSWDGKMHPINAPIYGEQHVGNIALACIAAIEVGISIERVIASLASTPQIKHRLEIKPQPDGTTYIDDAYNSNPIGFTAAVGLLSRIVKENGRRILVTPGLVELGARHDEIHRELGLRAADCADIVIVVKPQRIPTFLEGVRSKKNAVSLLEFESLNEALQWIKNNARPNDVILLENDLPDLYERKLVL